MAFASAMADLKLNISNFATNMKKASDQMAKFAASSVTTGAKANKTFDAYGKSIKNATSILGTHNLGLKDTSRIIQGILVSQMFYQAARAIREAVGALWDFNEQLDYASVTYTGLFGSQDLSDSFLVALRQQAEDTIFSFSDLADASKKLLAYGIPYKNLMFISEGLTNLGAMSGDAEALDRLAFALGQIYAKGKLSAEEMRQLANAYVPIQQILKDKLGLSEEDLSHVGDLNIPAADAINAIVDYANENFGTVGDMAMYTITGLKNKIVDSLKNMGVDMLKPLTTFYKSFLNFIAKNLSAISDAFKKDGAGGVFEYLVPDPNVQQRLRQFFANVQNLFATLLNFLQVIGTVFKSFSGGFITALNIILPVVNSILNVLAGAIQTITGNAAALRVLTAILSACAAAWVVFRIHAMASAVVAGLSGILYGVAKAVLALSTALTTSPLTVAIALVTALLVTLAVAANNANGAISRLFNKLAGLNGKSASNVFQRVGGSANNAANAASGFSERMKGATNSIKNMGNTLKGAGSKAKKASDELKAGLLSFDEVFKLNDKEDTTDLGDLGGLGDTDALDDILNGLDDLSKGLNEALTPEIPDFSQYATDFISGLKDSLLAKLAMAGIGALVAKRIMDYIKDSANVAKWAPAATKLVGTFAKALLGAAVGLAFDALASLLTDKLWQALEKAIGLKEGSAEQASFGATLGSVIGGAIGMVVGGLPGSLVGAAIGHLAGGIVGLAWQEITDSFASKFAGIGKVFEGALTGVGIAITKAFGASLTEVAKNLINTGSFSGFFKSIGEIFSATGLKAVAKGGLIGAAIGLVCDAIATLLWKTLQEKFNLSAGSTESAAVGQTIGSIIGMVIGGIFGGPPGAIIGSAIGTFAGGLVGLFWEKIKEAFAPVTDWLSGIVSNISTALSGWWEMTSTGFSDWWTNTTNIFSSWWDTTSSGFSTWWNNTTSGFSTWWSNTFNGLSGWWSDTTSLFSDWDNITSETLGAWWENTKQGFATWYTDSKEKLSTWWNETTEGFNSWAESTKLTLAAWILDTKNHLAAWKDETFKSIRDWVTNTAKSIALWATGVALDIKNWAKTTLDSITKWATDTYNAVVTWVKDTVKSFTDFGAEALRVIGGFTLAAKKAFEQWCSEVWNAIQNWFKGLINDVQNWWNDLWDPSNWMSGWDHVKSWFSDLFGGIRDWFSDLSYKVSNWWSSLWSNKKASVNIGSSYSSPMRGYASGGIVSRDQVARVAEGNRAEAIIPLEDEVAMQPFVNAISRGILEGLAPTLVQSGGSNPSSLPPMYVGTLIADDRGLKQLYKKFELMQVQENARRGTSMA